MSYFEVYNEKIHDLLIVKDEKNQKKMPVSRTETVQIIVIVYANIVCANSKN